MKTISIKKDNIGKRLDRFLKEEIFFNEEISRGEIIRQIKNGNVLVNKKSIKPSYILKENDVISTEHGTRSMEQKSVVPNSKINLKIIYQDKNIIVINKPAGLQVHTDFHEKNNTLANGIIAQFPEIKNVGEDLMRPGIVHRLDKDTSGVMIVARNQETFLELKNKFKNREVEKKYWAIVYGKPKDRTGFINKPLARATTYKKQVIAGKKTETKVREAVTYYEVLKTLGNLSLLEVTPKTGRMHQIRVHLTSIGHPIMGDKIYKVKKMKAQDVPRQMLHAKSIKFNLFGEDFLFEAPMPDDIGQFLTSNR